jgi:hypothetical protein
MSFLTSLYALNVSAFSGGYVKGDESTYSSEWLFSRVCTHTLTVPPWAMGLRHNAGVASLRNRANISPCSWNLHRRCHTINIAGPPRGRLSRENSRRLEEVVGESPDQPNQRDAQCRRASSQHARSYDTKSFTKGGYATVQVLESPKAIIPRERERKGLGALFSPATNGIGHLQRPHRSSTTKTSTSASNQSQWKYSWEGFGKNKPDYRRDSQGGRGGLQRH